MLNTSKFECFCDDPANPIIGVSEFEMAEALELPLILVHKFNDTWEKYCDATLGLAPSDYEERFTQAQIAGAKAALEDVT